MYWKKWNPSTGSMLLCLTWQVKVLNVYSVHKGSKNLATPWIPGGQETEEHTRLININWHKWSLQRLITLKILNTRCFQRHL